METPPCYKSSAEIAEIVRKFEACEYGKQEFYHSMHLVVAAWYLANFQPEVALDRMRSALLRFTRHHGVTAYHETITRFWLLLVQNFLQTTLQQTPLHAKVNELTRVFKDKNLLFEYYDRELVMSDEARHTWIEPNRKALTASLIAPTPQQIQR